MTDQQKKERKIEALLWLLGFTDGDKLVPGSGWGDSSVAALKAYQVDRKLANQTGELDDDTWESLCGEELTTLPEYNGRKTFQCLCIAAECDDDGQLIADDLGGDHTKVAFKDLMRQMFDRSFCATVNDGLV